MTTTTSNWTSCWACRRIRRTAAVFAGVAVPQLLADQWDEVTGKPLDKEQVIAGRMKELGKFQERQVYVPHLREEAMQDEGGKFVKTRWVQTEKGEEVRCRLVAQEFAHGDPRDDLFAGTPPLFAARLLRQPSGQPTTTRLELDVHGRVVYLSVCPNQATGVHRASH